MRVETNLIILSTAAIILFGIASAILIAHRPPAPVEAYSGSWACAADYLQCPNGSSVGRVPPYCHFASCPAGVPAVATN